MKIYTVNGRRVWLNEAPEGYEGNKPQKAEKPAETKIEAIETKSKPKAKNKARKAGSNK